MCMSSTPVPSRRPQNANRARWWKWRGENPDAVVVMTGCYEMAQNRAAARPATLLVPNHQKLD